MAGNGLFGSTVLDVAIGLIFVYLLLAILCTTVNEWIAGVFKLRSKTLEKGIQQLLDAQPGPSQPGAQPAQAQPGVQAGQGQPGADWFLQKFYNHPLVVGMKDAGAHPAYLPAETFATAVMDIASIGKEGSIAFADLETGIKSLPNGDVKTALLALIQNAGGNLARAQKNIEGWFDDTMDRVSGWYKRKIQLITVIISVVLAVGVNADTIRITRTLWNSPELRAESVKLAEQRAQQESGAGRQVQYPDKNKPLQPVAAPITPTERKYLSEVIGWDVRPDPSSPSLWIGWLLTIIAISMGAPFWFDVLNKFINIRNAGKSPTEQKKDRNATQAGTEPGK